MPVKNVLSGVTSSARNPVGTGLTALERSGDLSHIVKIILGTPC